MPGPPAVPIAAAGSGQWAAAAHGSPVLAVAALEPGGRTAVGRFDGAIGVHGGFGDDQRLAGRAAASLSSFVTPAFALQPNVDPEFEVFDSPAG
jgi:hypothetical protein